jgi:hypothetical protein
MSRSRLWRWHPGVTVSPHPAGRRGAETYARILM